MTFASLRPFAALDVLPRIAVTIASGLRATSLADRRGCTASAGGTR
jgi:hypothetical protein